MRWRHTVWPITLAYETTAGGGRFTLSVRDLRTPELPMPAGELVVVFANGEWLEIWDRQVWFKTIRETAAELDELQM